MSEEFKIKDKIENHHVHCKFLDNPNGFGDIIKLTKKNHIILHLKIPAIIWKYIDEKKKKKCIKEIENFTYQFVKNIELKEDIDNINKEIIDEDEQIESEEFICLNCGASLDIEDRICEYCGKMREGLEYEDK